MKSPRTKKRMNVWAYLALGYLAVVLLGSVLLILPFASRGGRTNYIDALFTSVSAACVTGLVPFETNIHWSGFGQAVILLLIQLGGLGFMTFVSVLLMMVKRGLGQYERRAVLQTMGGGNLSGVKRLIRRIFTGTACFELAGAALLSIRFIPDFGVGKGIWYSVFHAVSAFCNAGFDLMGGTFAGSGSFSHYAADPLVSLTLCVLIIVGGLGFCIWGDVIDCRLNPSKFQFYTKVILLVNTVLLTASTFLFLGFEWNNPTYAGCGFGEKLLASFFNATTARTAGFYTTDPGTLSDSGYLLMVILMFIGGSSGSTAGGIKVGTMTVIVMGMFAVFRGKRDINIGKRRIDSKLVFQALAIFVAYLFLVFTATIVICAIETNDVNTFANTLFETVSAIGTVGLSVSVKAGGGAVALTTTLTALSKVILILLMYTGRAGVLTIAFAVAKKRDTAQVRRPIDTFFIG